MSSVIVGDVSGPETARTSARVEVIAQMTSRRRFSVEQKQAIVAEAFSGRRSVREVARRLEMSTGLIYTWRRQLRAGRLAEMSFARVELAEPAAAPLPPATSSPRTGLIEVALGCGAVVRVDRDVDAAALARVLEVLR